MHWLSQRTVNCGGSPVPDPRLTANSWELLKRLSDVNNSAWLVRGDLNEILFNSEKRVGPPKSATAMNEFHEVMNDCGLRDLGYIGNKFTWSNKRGKDSFIGLWLDRFLASYKWEIRFNSSHIRNFSTVGSDHSPILLEINSLFALSAQGIR